MSASVVDIVTISQVVQAAVAPVFLITGVATLLNILSNRQSKLLDQAQDLQVRMGSDENADQEQCLMELKITRQRTAYVNGAFLLCSLSALVVCSVVVLLFYSSVATLPLAHEISVLFIAAMGLLFLGLLLLLREVFLASALIGKTTKRLLSTLQN